MAPPAGGILILVVGSLCKLHDGATNTRILRDANRNEPNEPQSIGDPTHYTKIRRNEDP